MAEEKPVVKQLSQPISIDVAEKDTNKWLDAKRVSSSNREVHKDHVEVITDAIVDGILTLKEDNSFSHKLLFPIEGDSSLDTLDYKSRLKISTVHSHLKGVKGGDADGRILAYVSALTSKPAGVIRALDTQDYSISQAIVVFFL